MLYSRDSFSIFMIIDNDPDVPFQLPKGKNCHSVTLVQHTKLIVSNIQNTVVICVANIQGNSQLSRMSDGETRAYDLFITSWDNSFHK